jgi:hypothetical protein
MEKNGQPTMTEQCGSYNRRNYLQEEHEHAKRVHENFTVADYDSLAILAGTLESSVKAIDSGAAVNVARARNWIARAHNILIEMLAVLDGGDRAALREVLKESDDEQ